MRRMFLLLMLVAGCASTGPKTARVAARTFDGNPIEVGAPSSKPTLIVFWATWCASCRDEMPKLTALAHDRAATLAILGVNVDTNVAAARKFLDDSPLPYPNVSDPELIVADTFGAAQTPTLILIDASGTELARAHDLGPVVSRLDSLHP